MLDEISIYSALVEPIASLYDKGVVHFVSRSVLRVKFVRRGVKAYRRYVSHGVRDPEFITNAASSLFAGASLLSLGGAKVLKFTNLSSASETLFITSSTLSSVADEIGECFEWHSPIF